MEGAALIPGATVRCTKCGQRLKLNRPEGDPPPAEHPDSSRRSPKLRAAFVCPKCNEILLVSEDKLGRAVFCPKCNERMKRDESDVVSSGEKHLGSATLGTKPRLKGVGGWNNITWLMFLCVILTIFFPLGTLGEIAKFNLAALKYREVHGQFPGIPVIGVIDIILRLGLVAFSFYAGVGLWAIRRGAVLTAKRFMLCLLAYTAVASILSLGGLLSEANGDIVLEVVSDAMRVAWIATWYLYLCHSERVKATYDS
jgi:DNA-directed RNA polymerase subunit RPC12/RpoP